jgi:hypothetical protein
VRRRLLWFFYLRKTPQISYYAFSRVAPNGLSGISKGGRNKGPNSMICVWWYEMRLYDMRVMIWDETLWYAYDDMRWDYNVHTVPTMTNVWHKIICKKSSCKRRKFHWYLLKIENHWVTYAQNEMYFPYLFLNCWNSWKIKFESAKPHFLK